MTWRPVDATGIAKVPAFPHAVVAGPLVFVSGMIGVGPDRTLVGGGVGPELTRALHNVELALAAARATIADVCKVSLYLAASGETARSEMNDAYLAFFGARRPARITVGATELAL